MGKINIGRVLLAGIVAGIVVNILGYLVDGLMLAPQWTAALTALGKTEFSVNQLIAFNVLGLINGIFLVGVYAMIRSRYGAGPKTAVYAGLIVWAIGTLLPNATLMGVTGLFPQNLTMLTTAAGIVELIVAALAGAALYRESATGSVQARAARA